MRLNPTQEIPQLRAAFGKARVLLTAVAVSLAFNGRAATNQPTAAAQGSAIFQMRLVTEAAAGDCDCDDMVMVQRIGETVKKESLHVLHPVLIDESDLLSAKVKTDNLGQPEIAIALNAKGARRFAEVTRNNIGKRLAIIIGGRVYSAPVIRTEISSGQAVINGSFGEDAAKKLAAMLNGAIKK